MTEKESCKNTELKRTKNGELRRAGDRESERTEMNTSQKQKIKLHRVLDSNSHECTDKIRHLLVCLISDCKNHQSVFEENFSFLFSSEKKNDDDAEIRAKTKTTMTAVISY